MQAGVRGCELRSLHSLRAEQCAVAYALGSTVGDAAVVLVRCSADRIFTGAVVVPQTGTIIGRASHRVAIRARLSVWDAAASLIATI
jgi:hypothetical protein